MPALFRPRLAGLAARAHGLAVLDGVHLDLADDEGFAFSCRQGRELGFDGRTLIHPRQIAPANIAYAPSAEEIDGRVGLSPRMPRRPPAARVSCCSTAS